MELVHYKGCGHSPCVGKRVPCTQRSSSAARICPCPQWDNSLLSKYSHRDSPQNSICEMCQSSNAICQFILPIVRPEVTQIAIRSHQATSKTWREPLHHLRDSFHAQNNPTDTSRTLASFYHGTQSPASIQSADSVSHGISNDCMARGRAESRHDDGAYHPTDEDRLNTTFDEVVIDDSPNPTFTSAEPSTNLRSTTSNHKFTRDKPSVGRFSYFGDLKDLNSGKGSRISGEKELKKDRSQASKFTRPLTSWDVKTGMKIDQTDPSMASSVDEWSHYSEERRKQLLQNREKRKARLAGAATNKLAVLELDLGTIYRHRMPTVPQAATYGQPTHGYDTTSHTSTSEIQHGTSTSIQSTQGQPKAVPESSKSVRQISQPLRSRHLEFKVQKPKGSNGESGDKPPATVRRP